MMEQLEKPEKTRFPVEKETFSKGKDGKRENESKAAVVKEGKAQVAINQRGGLEGHSFQYGNF